MWVYISTIYLLIFKGVDMTSVCGPESSKKPVDLTEREAAMIN